MKRVFRKIMSIVTLLVFFTTVSFADEVQTVIVIGTIETDGWHVKSLYLQEESKDVAIPAEDVGEPVVSLEAGALDGFPQVESIYIPASIKQIAEGVFANHKDVTLVVEQGSFAHQYAEAHGLKCRVVNNSSPNNEAEKQENAVTTPTPALLVQEYAWGAYKYKLCTKSDAVITGYTGNAITLSIPSLIDGYNVVGIGDYAFDNCDTLTSIKMPNGVTNIGDGAFSGCAALTSIKIPNSVTSIGDGAFSGCTALMSIEIPNSVTSIRDSTFSWCTALTSIEIPNSVTSIGNEAFSYCAALTSIEIPNNVTSIEYYAFSHCTALTSIEIPNNVTYIEDEAFSYCVGLTSVKIPDSVTSIGDSAFDQCSDRLVLTVGRNSYAAQYAAKNHIAYTHPSTPTPSSTPTPTKTPTPTPTKTPTPTPTKTPTPTPTKTPQSSPAKIGDIVTFGHYEQDGNMNNGKEPIKWIVFDESGSYRLLYAVNLLDAQPFDTKGGKDWLKSSLRVWLNNDFRNSAFTASEQRQLRPGKPYNNKYFTEDDQVFLLAYDHEITPVYGSWTGLSGAFIPSNFGEKGRILAATHEFAQATTYALSKYANTKEGYWTYDDVIDNMPPGGFMGLRGTSTTKYVRPACWVHVDALVNISAQQNEQSNARGDQTVYEYDLKANGNAVITRYTGNAAKLTVPSKIDGHKVVGIGDCAFIGCYTLTSVSLPDSVTTIGEYAFYECGALTSLEIPDGVTNIGLGAFRKCVTLTNIRIPAGVKKIAQSAFHECVTLTSVEIPNGVTSIGDWAFEDCEKLTSVKIPDSVTSIGDGAFSWCAALTSIEIPNSVTSIGANAFNRCAALTRIKMPNSVTNIRDRTFRCCRALTSIEIPNNVISIGEEAFSDCDKLTSVKIPDSVTSIGKAAFSDCDKLVSVKIPDSVTSIGADAFAECSDKLVLTVGYNSYAVRYALENHIAYTYVSTPTPSSTPTPTPTPSPTPTPTKTPQKSTIKIGDIVTFGHYEQDGNVSNGKEPIKWIVYDENGSYRLLYAVNVLDVQPFDTKGSKDWLQSSLRLWLNNDFRDNAFTASEQRQLRPGKPYNNKYFTKDDQVFLLANNATITPVNELGLSMMQFKSNYTGKYRGVGLDKHDYAPATAYVLSKYNKGGDYFWEYGALVQMNEEQGKFYTRASSVRSGVRPACWVHVDALESITEP